ncbi:hypothetical protein TELCIR_11848 [Teladorsagia circumcincta]|uniref:Triacylglycerol lipase n=1 Tax=Teladorsagia circumcincta TaxID=45464 RepID=A0A2G9U853_TELCI|nr:hypothetical protein TELCIR_11848 [Teladorsagia circumcincta]
MIKPYKSKEVPKSVHSVRFADIKVFAALGDSLSAGNGANARGPLGLLKEFRGVSFVGGDMTLEEHITIPNVLRKFNPNLFGYSTGTGKWNSWKVSKLNMAIPGSEAKDMPVQAQRLVDVMRQRNEINITNDWKLVNIFVGGNDVCRHCHELHTNRSTVQQEIMDEGLFDSSDDFALVLQPFAKGIDHPPLTDCPLFPTTKNSKNCTAYMTPSVLDG